MFEVINRTLPLFRTALLYDACTALIISIDALRAITPTTSMAEERAMRPLLLRFCARRGGGFRFERRQ